MTYNTRVLAMTAIFLVAVLFLAAAPVYAASGTPVGTEVSTTILGYKDLTGLITNPSFEQNVVGDGTSTATITGWTTSTGANKAFTFNPNNNIFNDTSGGLTIPNTGLLPYGNISGHGTNGGTATCTPPTGYQIADNSGYQCVGVFADSMIEQAITGQTTGVGQTYVMTWEFGMPNSTFSTDAWGYTVGLFYSTNSWFLLVNNDTSFDTTHSAGGHYLAVYGVMQQFSYSFFTGTDGLTGKVMTLRFGGGTTSTKSAGFNFYDNIHLYGQGAGVNGVAVPEPATMVLVLTGALGMLAYAWRRKRKN